MEIFSKSQLFLLCLLLATTAEKAYAYFDPGTGSMLIQVLIALIGLTVAFFSKAIFKINKFTQKIRPLFMVGGGDQLFTKHYMLAISISIYAVLFYSSHNTQGLTLLALILNIFLFIFSSLLLTTVCILASQRMRDQEKFLQGFLFLLFIYYMHSSIAETTQIFYIEILGDLPTPMVESAFTTTLGFFFFLMGRWFSNHTTKVIVVIAIMCILPAFKLVKEVYLIALERNEAKTAGETLFINDGDIVFQRKPNVYFLLFDSYTNNDGIKTLGLSPSPRIYGYLNEREFVAYKSFFTNIQPTINALSTYFSMNIKLGSENYYDIFWRKKHRIVSGGNKVFNLFKKNGYTTNIIISNNGTGAFDSNYYLLGGFCFADRCLGNVRNWTSRYFEIFNRVALNNMYKLGYFSSQTTSITHSMKILREITNDREKQFVFMHLGLPNHSIDIHSDSMGTCSEKLEVENYAGRLNQAHLIMIRIVDNIEQSDPNALIIIASDHGPFILNRCSNGAPLLTKEEVVERQGAFLAIRWGKDYDGRYDKDIKSSANLFRYIFSYLAGNEKLLENKPDDDAFYQYKGKVIKSIDDGVILPPPAAELNKSN